MGTVWSARIVDAPADARATIEAVCDNVIAQMSHWQAGSQISRFNHAAPGGWHRIGPDFAEVMRAALDIATRSGGAFDPAMGALADLWGFGPPGPRTDVPADDEIAAAHRHGGVAAIDFDPLLLRLRRDRPVRLDLSGIAKGYAVDALGAALRQRGCTDFLVEIGGELSGSGVQPDGQPWWTDVEPPPGTAQVPLRVALHGLAIATSGDYRRGFEVAGTRHAHTIDPRTGRPVANGVVSVTVIDASCMIADGWASALTVLGTDDGMALAVREGLAALMLVREGAGLRELVSPALAAMLD